MNYFVYIAVCSDNTLYSGITTDLKRRIKQHNGLLRGGAKYTKGRRPVRLCYFETFGSRSEAQIREGRLKKLSAQQKKKLIEESNIAILKT